MNQKERAEITGLSICLTKCFKASVQFCKQHLLNSDISSLKNKQGKALLREEFRSRPSGNSFTTFDLKSAVGKHFTTPLAFHSLNHLSSGPLLTPAERTALS
jgi:hypothetical protein